MTINHLDCISLYIENLFDIHTLLTSSREDITKPPDYIPPTVYNYLKNNDVELEEVLTNLAFEKIEI